MRDEHVRAGLRPSRAASAGSNTYGAVSRPMRAAVAIISTSSPKPMPVSSRLARNVPSIRPTVGKFCTPEKPSSSMVCRNRSMVRNGSVPQTPASTACP